MDDMIKYCPKCDKDKSEEDFNWKYKNKCRQHSCKDCQYKYQQSWYNNPENKKSSINRAKVNKDNHIKRNQAFLIEVLKNNPCKDCGITDFRVLEFDHQGEKEGNICDMVRRAFSLSRIKKEIEKCEVVCANCHRIRSGKTFNHFKSLAYDLEQS